MDNGNMVGNDGRRKLTLEELREGTADVPLDRGKDGQLLFSNDIVNLIQEMLADRKAEKVQFELRWTLNANFLAGNQFCEINVHSNTIEQYDPLYDWMEHNSYNKIIPLYDTRQANLNSLSYMMTVKPRTDEIDDWEKAMISTRLLRYVQDSTEFTAKCSQATAWSELTGTAFWLSWWDKDAGEVISEGPERIMSGDIKYGLLTPYEVFPESVYKQEVEDQRSIIIEQIMTVDDIYDVYGAEVDGKDVTSYALMPIAGGGGTGYETTCFTYQQKTTPDAEYVVTFFERNSRRYPRGRMAVVIGDTLMYYGSLPYDRIPIVAQKCKNVPGVFFGSSWIETVIPLQRSYNGVKNKVHDYIKTIAANTMSAEEGSFDVDEYVENGTSPGAIVSYKSGYQAPEIFEYPELPQTVVNEMQQLTADMEYAAGVSQLMVVGGTPQGVDSGKAIDSLRKIDNTRMSLTGENIRAATKQLAVIWLSMYKNFAAGYRVVHIVGSNDVGSALTWCSEDINSFDIKYDTENELKVSEELQKENFLAAYQMNLFTDENGKIDPAFKQKALELMKIGNYTELMSVNEQHRKNARRENAFFEKGVIPEIGEYDNHQIHISEHTAYALQMNFNVFKRRNPELAQMFMAHMKAHEQAIADINIKLQQTMMLQQVMSQQNAGSPQKGK